MAASTMPGWISVPNLVYRYAELIDRGDFAGVGALFADAVVVAGDMVVEGAAGVEALFVENTRRFPDNGTPHTRHVTTNLILDVDDEAGTATCRSYVTVFQRTDDFPLQPVFTNRYEDEFDRVDGTWRFRKRVMIDAYPGDVSQHLLHAFEGGV